MRHHTTPAAANGFTLIELLVVMMLLIILSVGTVRFLNDASSGYLSGTQRGELAADLRHVAHHIGITLREATPNSLRVSAGGTCLELLPVASASVYLSAPLGYADTTMRVVPFDSAPTPATWRVALAPSASLYNLTSPGAISPTATASAPDTDNIVTLSFAATHQFAAASPRQRFFAVTQPVSYCLDNDSLYRYTNYGYQATQPDPTSLPTTLPDRSLLASGLQPGSALFALTPASLTRNASVAITLTLNKGDDQLSLTHAVHVRNQT